jgi:hypothetical protein
MEDGTETRVFVRQQKVALQATGFIAGGVAILLMSVFIFVASLNARVRPGHDMTPGILGGISVLWIGMLARGIFLLRQTVRVVLDPAGVHLERVMSRWRSIGWGEIRRIDRDKHSTLFGDSYELIRLIGESGKPLAEVSETIENYQFLANEIAMRSAAASGRATYDATEDERRRGAKERRKRRWLAALAGIITLGMGAGFVVGLNEQVHTRRYARDGAKVEARIVRRWMLRVTPWIEYSFRDSRGREFSREAMMDQRAWDQLEGRRTVGVEYLASDPTWNRLTSGEERESGLGGGFLYIAGAMTLVFGGMFVFLVLGFDLKSEDGVTTLTRRGRVVKQWGAGRAGISKH